MSQITAQSAALPLPVLAACAAILGALAGGLLNILISRTPRITAGGEDTLSFFAFLRGLVSPPLQCPHCRRRIAARDLLPVLSYLRLRGRCRHCSEPYGARHLVVELASAGAAATCVFYYGATAMAGFTFIFVLGLIALTFLDLEEEVLPDAVVFPLFALGLVFNILFYGNFYNACAGAVAAFASLWLVRITYHAYAGIEGLGYGDLKLGAMIGAWVGLAAVPVVLFMAFAIGVIFMAPIVAFCRRAEREPQPFSPFLAISTTCVLALPALAGFPLNLFTS